MNSKFDFQDKSISRFNKNKHLRIKRPLCIAAISGSIKVNLIRLQILFK